MTEGLLTGAARSPATAGTALGGGKTGGATSAAKLIGKAPETRLEAGSATSVSVREPRLSWREEFAEQAGRLPDASDSLHWSDPSQASTASPELASRFRSPLSAGAKAGDQSPGWGGAEGMMAELAGNASGKAGGSSSELTSQPASRSRAWSARHLPESTAPDLRATADQKSKSAKAAGTSGTPSPPRKAVSRSAGMPRPALPAVVDMAAVSPPVTPSPSTAAAYRPWIPAVSRASSLAQAQSVASAASRPQAAPLAGNSEGELAGAGETRAGDLDQWRQLNRLNQSGPDLQPDPATPDGARWPGAAVRAAQKEPVHPASAAKPDGIAGSSALNLAASIQISHRTSATLDAGSRGGASPGEVPPVTDAGARNSHAPAASATEKPGVASYQAAATTRGATVAAEAGNAMFPDRPPVAGDWNPAISVAPATRQAAESSLGTKQIGRATPAPANFDQSQAAQKAPAVAKADGNAKASPAPEAGAPRDVGSEEPAAGRVSAGPGSDVEAPSVGRQVAARAGAGAPATGASTPRELGRPESTQEAAGLSIDASPQRVSQASSPGAPGVPGGAIAGPRERGVSGARNTVPAAIGGVQTLEMAKSGSSSTPSARPDSKLSLPALGVPSHALTENAHAGASAASAAALNPGLAEIRVVSTGAVPGSQGSGTGRTLSDASRNPFPAMDSIDTAKTASRTEGDGRLAAGRSATGAVGELQVGYQDPSMGYVELRAHADGSGIHASLGAQTPAAGETLEGHLSSLAGWMNERHTPVESLTVLMPASQANAQPDFRGKESEAQSLADGMGSGGDVGTGGGHAQDGGRGNEDAASGGWPRTSSLAESDSAAAPAPASRWGGGWGVAPVPPGAGSISVLA